jgi:hypothetical protein
MPTPRDIVPDIHLRRFLDLSTAHITPSTCAAACARAVPWANTTPTSHGFIVYAHDERASDGFDDLWAVLQFARAQGCDYVMFDADASTLPEAAGLPTWEW